MIRLAPLALLMLIIPLGVVQAQEAATDITVHSPYTSVAINSGEASEFELDLKINNTGDETAIVDIEILSGPDSWNAHVYSKFKSVEVRRVQLLPGGDTQDLVFRFLVPEDVTDGNYTFLVGFFDQEDRVLNELNYQISVGDPNAQRPRPALGEIVQLEPRYTGLAGSKDSSFQFRVDLKNSDLEDRQFGLEGEGPPGWQVSFKPAFQDTLIASLGLKAETDQALEVTVQPPGNAEPGLYTILLKATAEGVDPAVVPIQVQLTGTPQLSLATLTGRLNADTTAGEESEIKLILVNTGSAGLDNIRFLSNAPEGWKFNFDPQAISHLEPTELAEITAIVAPPDKTIPGDYSVDVFATALDAQTDASLRITVGRSTSFGWVGILIVVLVFAGIGGLFVRLGRR